MGLSMVKLIKWFTTFMLSAVMVGVVWANDYHYFSITLDDGWFEFIPQKQTKNGDYLVVFSNKAQDTAITITASPRPGKLSTQDMVQEAQQVIDRLQRQNIKFVAANYDEQQGVFAAAGQQVDSQQQWRVVMTQENAILYTVLFNGNDVDGASRILNTLKSIPEPLFE